jgi:outer membrane protein OmpA-like peptidoglycan-associated protein
MTSPRRLNLQRATLRTALFSALLVAAPALLPAQAPAPAAKATRPPTSRLDLYGGYGYIHPVDSDINNQPYQPINPGAVTSVSGYFLRNLGLQAEGSFFPHGPNDCIYTAQAGPIARMQVGRFIPFAHALVGGAKVGGPVFQPCTWGLGITSGIGLDYLVRGFGDHLAIRPIQADYEYSRVDYGPLVTPADVSGGLGKIQAYRLSAGVVLRFGDMNPKPPVTIACSVQPQSGFAGDPLVATAIATDLNPRKPATYTWQTTGGAITPQQDHANISTTGAKPGVYTATATVMQGAKAGQSASCTASFTVRDFDPPTLTCSATPDSVNLGDTSVIVSEARSPQGRPLTYSYTADSGDITGTTASAILRTTGATPGQVGVTCNVVDDLGKTATARTLVTVIPIPKPRAVPLPEPIALCSVAFDRDKKRPSRVDNEAKGCLDQIAIAMQRQSADRLVLTGNRRAAESATMAAQRAVHVKQYLVAEKGIDATRIDLRSGTADTANVDSMEIPVGAVFAPGDSQAVDPASLPEPVKPAPHRKHARKAAKHSKRAHAVSTR